MDIYLSRQPNVDLGWKRRNASLPPLLLHNLASVGFLRQVLSTQFWLVFNLILLPQLPECLEHRCVPSC